MFESLTDEGAWLCQEMQDFTCSGKMLRGALVFVGLELFNDETSSTEVGIRQEMACTLAAGLELLQSGLLVHDDIMDHDATRRGKPTFHYRLAKRLPEKRERISREEGSPQRGDSLSRQFAAEAQGICVGDLFFFLGWQEIASLGSALSSLVAHEHSLVTLAQMQDIAMSYDYVFPSLNAVTEMYRNKTARYTISLPLIAGASIAIHQTEARTSIIRYLEAFGEALGIAFQLQDDRLGLFGNEQETGKPVGSDLKEGKKTPYIILLKEALDEASRARLEAILGSPHIVPHDLQWIQESVIAHGIDKKVDALIQSYTEAANEALASIEQLPFVSAAGIELLKGATFYLTSRTR